LNMSHQAEPIAVIGSACRFPGNSNTPSKLWSLLSQPKDVLSKIPNDRFNPAGHYHPDGLHHGTTNVQESYFLRENIKAFDAQFFGMKAVEARTMDPQQRLLLESVYESLEHAGLPIEDLAGSKAGVFVGQMCEDWSIHLRRDPDKVPVYTATGTARSILSNRVSYFFNWHGPSMTIDTACSSSLVAVHLAVQSLRNGEAPIAVVCYSFCIVFRTFH
jgi:hybrid polyketide synthase/nonribosomal peptide synthetase ACE1